MAERNYSRRSFLKAGGAVAVAAAGGATLVNRTSAATGSWTAVPDESLATTKTLYSVTHTTDGPYAVGKTGNVLAREDPTAPPGESAWRKVVDAGPATRDNSLRAMAATAGGKRIWFAGSSGALGAYDVESGTKYNYSAPHVSDEHPEMTSTWEAIAVTGNRESENVYVANGSGEVVDGHTDSEGCIQWDTVVKPGSGSTIPAIDFRSQNIDVGHTVDTSGGAYRTEDASTTWSKVGVPSAQVGFYDLVTYADSDGTNKVFVAGGSGKIFRLDCGCERWTPIEVGSETLYGIDRLAATGQKVVAGTGGAIYESTTDSGWQSVTSNTSDTLRQVSLAGEYGDFPDVAVGTNGAIVER